MDPQTAVRLGDYLRARRLELGWSAKTLADHSGSSDATVIRIEQGRYASPRAETLSRLAEALELPVADVFARAGYVAPRDLPGLRSYLEARYRDLPETTIEQIEQYVDYLVERHGEALRGPDEGEDEQPS